LEFRSFYGYQAEEWNETLPRKESGMSHRDKNRVNVSGTNAQGVLAALQDLLANVDWKGIRFRTDCQWSVPGLAMAALLWAWASKKTLTERFARALRIMQLLGRHFAPEQASYQGFLELLVRWTVELRLCLVLAFQARMELEFPNDFRIAGYVVLAGDGSNLQLPRTRSNQACYAPAKTRKKNAKKRRKPGSRTKRPKSQKAREKQSRSKKAESPQMSLTALLHVGLRLPWDWRLGSSDTSEREHLRSMIASLPPDALLTTDCGFAGYEFWSELLASKREFVIRVGGNVRLLKKLGIVRESYGTIYLWPDKAAKRKQPPLVLRLVEVHDGRQSWFLVTSVRDPQRLSDKQIAQIYASRWRVELFFRNFKQTFGRAKLRSLKAEHARCEAEWSLLGLWGMMLHAQIQQKARPQSTSRLSVARVLRIFGQAIDEFESQSETGQSFKQKLRSAVIDPYRRKDKTSRNYPRKKYESQPKPPIIHVATPMQKQLAKHVLAITSQKP
jgi:DDE family transposase